MINQKEIKQVNMDSWLLKLLYENKIKKQRSTNKQS